MGTIGEELQRKRFNPGRVRRRAATPPFRTDQPRLGLIRNFSPVALRL